MKIAHINNTSGIASVLSTQQTKAGHGVDIFIFDDVTYRLFGGKKISYRSPVSKWVFFRSLKKYDIWHYHYPYGKLKDKLENCKRGKALIKHYHGDDLRGHEEHEQCLVSTPDLLKWAPNAIWLPNPVNVSEIESRYVYAEQTRIREAGALPKVGYYPFFKYYPGHDFIQKVLFELHEKKKLIPVEIFNLSHAEALAKISECDIIVGKILPGIGWYGQFEVESMVLRRPVMGYISDELFCQYHPPIYRTSKDSFGTDIVELLADFDFRNKLAHEGINYVNKYHDVRKVMPLLEECYAKYLK